MCLEVNIRDIKIESTVSQGAGSAAISCQGGVARSHFANLLIVNPGIGINCIGITDSIAIHDCQFWFVKGTGIRIGHGSEIQIIGGRIIGVSKSNGSVGIHLTGDNGGVYITGGSVINFQYAVLIENLTGAGSNREVFFINTALDKLAGVTAP